MRIENFTKVSLSNINSITPIIESQLINSESSYPPGTVTYVPILALQILDDNSDYGSYYGFEGLEALLGNDSLIAFRYEKRIGHNKAIYVFPLVEGSISSSEFSGMYFGVNSLYKWNYVYPSGQGRYTANVADINIHVNYDMIEYIDSNMSGVRTIDVSFNNDSFEIFGIKPSSESGEIYVEPELVGCLSNIFNALKTTVTNIYPSEGPAIEYLDMSRIGECVDMIKSSQPMGGLLFCKQLHYEQYDPATSSYMGSEIVDESKLFGITDEMYPEQGIAALIYSCQLYPVIDQGDPASADIPDFLATANCIVYPLKSEFYYYGQNFSFPEINKWYMVYYANNIISYHEVVKVPKMNVEMNMLNFEDLTDAYEDTIVYSGDVYFAHNSSSILYYAGTSYVPIYKGHELYELVSYMFNKIGCSNKDNELSTLERLNMTNFPNEFRDIYHSDWYMESAIELLANRGGVTSVLPRLTTRLNYHSSRNYFTLTYNLTSGGTRGFDFLQLHYFIDPVETYIQGDSIYISSDKTNKWYAIETRSTGHVFINIENPYFFIDTEDLRYMSGSRVYDNVKYTNFEFLNLDYNSVRLYFSSIPSVTGYQMLQEALDSLGVVPEKTVCDGNHDSTTPGTPEVGPSTVSVEAMLNSIAKNVQEATGRSTLIKGSELSSVVSDALSKCGGGKTETTKTVTPSKSEQIVTADDPSTQTLSRVTVEAIPADYVMPVGDKTITENDTYDVKYYETVTVRVPQPSGTITLSSNATYYDVRNYASAYVAVPVSGGSGEDRSVELLTKTISSYTDTAGISAIGAYAFTSCSLLSSIDFPWAKTIGSSAFQNCSKLVNVNIPQCSSIGDNAFSGCSSLASINLSVCGYVGRNAFASCSRMSEIYLPVCSIIDYAAFSSCSSLASIDLPMCTSINSSAFARCRNLSYISIPVCSYIGQSAFNDCSNLKSIEAPECLVISGSAFEDCSALSYISFPKCQSIYNAAFSYCSKLTTFDFPECTTLGSSYGYYNIFPSETVEVNIPKCEYIGPSVFASCSKLLSISLPVCSFVGSCAFSRCNSLSTIYFGAIATISSSAFYECMRLKSVYINTSSVPTLKTGVFVNTAVTNSTIVSSMPGYGSIFVRESLVSSFKAASNWSALSDRIVGYTFE